MKVGELVVVLGKIDQRIRDKKVDGLVIGTMEQVLCDSQVSVLLENGDIWVGLLREVKKAEEQK